MTACAFVHPYGLPTIISDLVTSFEPQQLQLTPSNCGIGLVPHTIQKARLARKAFSYGDPPLVLAFSGSIPAIKDITGAIGPEIGRLGDRPMRIVGDMVNSYIDQKGRRVSAVGFRSCQDGTTVNVLRGYHSNTQPTQHLNEISVCGTGSEWLKRTILLADTQFNHSSWALSDSESRLVGLMGFINSCAIFGFSKEDAFSGLLHSADIYSFGGYFEAIICPKDCGTIQIGQWVHLGYEVDLVRKTAWPLPKQVF